MLINLTNHPLRTWSEEQKNTATELFGEVVDMPFPHINPKATEVEIQELAQQYAQEIIRKYPDENITLHLMGELCFCFSLLKILQKKGIKVVASTTERIVTETNTQQKTVIFKFVKFREYC